MFDPKAVIQMEGLIQAMASKWQRNFARIAAIDWDGFVSDTRAASEQLARSGWTLPMQLTVADVMDLAGEPIDKVDAFFVDHYTAGNFAALRRARRELLSRPGLSTWWQLLDECFEVFESGKHLITVPALISTIEGVVSYAGNSLHKQNVSRKFLVGVCANKAKGLPGGGIHALMWRSLEIFIEKLFQDAPFDKSRPIAINRHWILHGRDSANSTVADSLRLFSALETIDSLLE
jgi:hypothetical protein